MPPNQVLKVMVRYTLTLDTSKHRCKHIAYWRMLSKWLHKTMLPEIEYEFYVETGKRGNPHAHGWFLVPEGLRSVLVHLLRKYKKEFGFPRNEDNTKKSSSTKGHTWITYSRKEHIYNSKYIFNMNPDTVVLTKKTCLAHFLKRVGKKEKAPNYGGVLDAMFNGHNQQSLKIRRKPKRGTDNEIKEGELPPRGETLTFN